MIHVEDVALITISLKCSECGVEWDCILSQRGFEQRETCECRRCQGVSMYFMGALLETVPQEKVGD